MDQIESARVRLEQATGLPAVLDAAYDAFEEMLSALEEQEDRGGAAFAAFVMSATAAANGRDALAAAPSLPPAPSGDLAAAAAGSSRGLAMEDAAAVLARAQPAAVQPADRRERPVGRSRRQGRLRPGGTPRRQHLLASGQNTRAVTARPAFGDFADAVRAQLRPAVGPPDSWPRDAFRRTRGPGRSRSSPAAWTAW